MTAHYGFPDEVFAAREATFAGTAGIVRARPTLLEDGRDCERRDGAIDVVQQGRGQSVTSKQWGGADWHSFGDDQIFDRVWIVPTSIDFEFITEDADTTFEVWNAYLERSVSLTAVDLSGDTTGISITSPDLPYSLSPFGLKEFTVAVTAAGPSQQSSIYTLTIDGVAYTVTVVGIRTLTITHEPNWKRGIDFEHAYQTVVSRNVYFNEQRRPLSAISWRRVRLAFDLTGVDAQQLFNMLSYGHDKVFAIPVYHEGMRITDATVGGVSITTTDATTDLWNLNNRTTYIMLVDHDAGTVEIKEIDTIDTNEITTVEDIVTTFAAATTMAYPVLFTILHSVRVEPQSDATDTVELQFREYLSG